LLRVMVPPPISALLSLLCDAISCNLANSFVICCNPQVKTVRSLAEKHKADK
jgi:hypothetical protein